MLRHGAAVSYGNLVNLKSELPLLIERARGLIERLSTWGREHLPLRPNSMGPILAVATQLNPCSSSNRPMRTIAVRRTALGILAFV